MTPTEHDLQPTKTEASFFPTKPVYDKQQSCFVPNTNIPSGNLTQQWKITIFNGKIHYKWPFSIAMLVYQRVDRILSPSMIKPPIFWGDPKVTQSLILCFPPILGCKLRCSTAFFSSPNRVLNIYPVIICMYIYRYIMHIPKFMYIYIHRDCILSLKTNL